MKCIGKYELEVIRFTGTCDVIVTSMAGNSGLGPLSKNGTILNVGNSYVASSGECEEAFGINYPYDLSSLRYVDGTWVAEARHATNDELAVSTLAWYNEGYWWAHEGKTIDAYNNGPFPDGTN